MKKLANHIILSGITVSMLFSPLMALPSGGKFTHGTSGTINTNGNNMDIMGKGQNSVIQWGGGFSIGKGESVNFGGKDKNYLNIAHGTDKSTIEGVLNAGSNNVFLINPNGVIITKTGTINANRFVASTSSMSDGDMWKFAKSTQEQGAAFSPVFKPNGGNVVNMGNINAKNVTLQGNKVMLSADTSWDDKNNKIKFNQITADSIDLKGNEVYVDISTINSKNLTTEAKNKGIAYLSTTGYYYNPTRKYNDIVFTTKGNMDKTYNQYISIGSDLDWWHFAKGWNEKDDFRNNVVGDTFKLTNDIDFKASSGQNYANYWVDLNGDGKRQANEFTNMIVGYKDDSAFTKTFDGQGFTLKNINIDTTKLDNKPRYVGLFGKVDGANFANINVDYKNGGINASNEYVGGFAGYIDGFVDGISIKNIKYINNNADITLDSGYMTYYGTGGFAGDANGMFRNIYLDNIQNITVRANLTDNSKIPEDDWWYDPRIMLNYGVGGFAGTTFGIFENIHIKNSGNLELNYKTNPGNKYPTYGIGVGGFTGNATGGIYNGILLQNIKTLKTNYLNNNTPIGYRVQSFAGGFAGRTSNGSYKNISINEIGKIENISNRTNGTGGFAGWIDGGDYSVISINDIEEINSISEDIGTYTIYSGGFAGVINIGSFNNIKISKIGEIYAKGEYSYSGGFIGYIGSTWNSNIVDPIFNDIVISNIGALKADTTKEEFTAAYTGGFAGYINSGKFSNISIEDINNITASTPRSSYTGGFAGVVGSGKFNNISIEDINNITASTPYLSYAGGFAGTVGSGEFNEISIKDIINISAKDTAGGFAGKIAQSHASGKAKAIYENIKIEDIKNITSKDTTGGFAGHINAHNGKFKNISINNIGNIESIAGGYSYAGGFAGHITNAFSSEFSFIALNNINNITVNPIGYGGDSYAGGFAGQIYSGKFSNISLNHIQNIKSLYTPENENKRFAKKVYAGGFAGQIYSGILENISIYDIKNIHAINNAQHHGSDIENGGKSSSYAGGFAGDMYTTSKFNNIYMYFTPNSIIKSESKLNESYAGKFAGVTTMSGDGNLDISNIHIYHHKKDLTNATADQKYWGNEIQLHPYDDNNQGYIDFKTAALVALNGLKEIDCGTGRKCLVFTSDFKVDNPNITSPDIPDFNAKQPEPSIPNIEDIINEQATLDTDDILDLKLLEQIIADLKDKFYVVDINTLNDLLKAYSKIDKDNPASKAEFLANYLLSKDKYSDKERLDIAHSMIQSLDFLLAYQDNGLDKASDDKFASKEAIKAKNDILTEVFTASNQANTNKDKVNNFIQYLNNEVNKINSANNEFKEKNYYKQLNDLALAYNKYVELINKGLASKDDQAFKDISGRLFALIARVGDETEAIERLIKDFEDLKTQVSKNSNGHFVVTGELSAIKIPYPILASIKDDNGGEIEIPDKPDLPEIDLDFKQTASLNLIGDNALDEEEETEEIDETSLLQKGKTCIVSDNYKTMNPCVVGGL